MNPTSMAMWRGRGRHNGTAGLGAADLSRPQQTHFIAHLSVGPSQGHHVPGFEM
jgi:hypothetical protein